MRISDIHFREVQTEDLTYLMSNDQDFKPQTYRDTVTNELYDIDLSDWRESLRRLCLSPWVSLWNQSQVGSDRSHRNSQFGSHHGGPSGGNHNLDQHLFKEELKEDPNHLYDFQHNQGPPLSAMGRSPSRSGTFAGGTANNVPNPSAQSSISIQRGNLNANRAQIIEYVKQRKLVGIACFYKQPTKSSLSQFHLADDPEEREGLVHNRMPGGEKENREDRSKGSEAFNNILIGMILLHVHQPKNDSSFPEALRSLPIFQGKVRLKKENQISHGPNKRTSELGGAGEQYKSVSTFFVDSSTQVANILLMAVVP
jgi:hypothetical protein